MRRRQRHGSKEVKQPRTNLAELWQSGKRTARFRARYEGKSREGNIILKDVQAETGYCSHLWIPRHGSYEIKNAVQGQMLEFTADLKEYNRSGIGPDFCLINPREVTFG